MPRILTGYCDEVTPDCNLGYYDTFDFLIVKKKHSNVIFFSEFEIPNPVVGALIILSWGHNSYLQILLLKSL